MASSVYNYRMGVSVCSSTFMCQGCASVGLTRVASKLALVDQAELQHAVPQGADPKGQASRPLGLAD